MYTVFIVEGLKWGVEKEIIALVDYYMDKFPKIFPFSHHTSLIFIYLTVFFYRFVTFILSFFRIFTNLKILIKNSFIMHLKRLVSFSLLLVFCLPILANAQWVGVNNDNANPAEVNIVSSDINTSVLQTTVDGFNKKAVTTQRGEAFIINIDNSSRILEKGSPDLPKLTGSIIIPDKNAMDIKIVDSEYTEIHNIEIAPSKGNLLRTVDPSTVPYEYGKIYQKDNFYPGTLAELNKPYIARDYRGQTVVFYPYQYNPVTKTLRVYHSIEVEVYKTSNQGTNEFATRKSFKKVDREFNRIYEKHFLNFDNSRYTPLEEEGPMLVISYADYMDEMQDLVDWKNTTGRPTEMVDIATIGNTSSAIKTYITDYYNNNGLTYVLLVGDDAQVTTSSTTAGDSDNEYGYISGNDHYQEIFIGRFSAESDAEVTTQVQRTLDYEQGSFPANDWLNVSVGIASDQGPGDDNEYDYEHVRNMQTDLLGFTYTTNHELFDGSQGGNDDPGSPSPSDVAADVNPGAGVILYTGHGSTTSWGSSGFSNTNVNQLTNTGMLPFIWSVACVNGNFVGTTCFAEAWLRATDANGDPTGSIAMFASTINQSWDPPMEGQDEMVDILVESYTDNIKRTYGGISINGCFKMNDTYGSGGDEMTDTWTIFGDPSLMVRTDNPSAMSVTHTSGMIFGSGSLTVNCDVEDALVSITKDNDIIGTAYVSGGSADVPVSGVNPGDILDVTVTAFNAQPYMGNVTVIAPSGPYVIYDSYSINGENTIDYGQTQDIDITLINVGPDDASNVTASLTTSDIYVTELINNQDISFGNITGDNGTSTSSGNFTVTVSDTVPDQHVISFELTVTDENDSTWTSSFNVTANAPIVTIGDMVLSNDNDGNGRLDPGESCDLTFITYNEGHAPTGDATAILEANSPYFTINEETLDVTPILGDSSAEVTFNVSAHDSTVNGTLVNLNYVFVDRSVDSSSFELTIGQPPQITIGSGSAASSQYPFYTYYENNRSQMLYLGSELGSGEKLIQEIAFDFTAIGAIPVLTDLYINFKSTTTEQIGNAYEDMSDATNVFYSASYTMPTATGWHVFDVDDFLFNGTDSNLIVEVIWGDNGNWDDEFVVACTDMPNPMVAYGYSDTETPPNYDGNTTTRPNLMLYFAGDSGGAEHTITFTVIEEGTSNIIPGATVKIGSLCKEVDVNGQTTFDLLEGDYTCHAEAENHNPETMDMTVDGEESITIELVNNEGVTEAIEAGFNLYPNPASENITIESDKVINQYQIISMTGKMVMEKIIENNKAVIDVSNLITGVYFIRIQSQDQVITQKIQIIK